MIIDAINSISVGPEAGRIFDDVITDRCAAETMTSALSVN